MSFLKSFTISDGTTTTEFVAQDSSNILMPKENQSDPDVTIAEKIAALEASAGGGGVNEMMCLDTAVQLKIASENVFEKYFKLYVEKDNSSANKASAPISTFKMRAYDKTYLYFFGGVSRSAFNADIADTYRLSGEYSFVNYDPDNFEAKSWGQNIPSAIAGYGTFYQEGTTNTPMHQCNFLVYQTAIYDSASRTYVLGIKVDGNLGRLLAVDNGVTPIFVDIFFKIPRSLLDYKHATL